MSVTAEMIKELRQATGVGILDCRNALEEAKGDYDEAVKILREKGLAKAAKRADRDASEGVIELYTHGDGRVGVMVEVNSETDFVARSDAFRHFAHEIALQIAAMSPHFIHEEDIPEEILERERGIARKRALEEGKPENVVERIVAGRMGKFLDDTCLLRQPYIREEEILVQDLLLRNIASLGENIVIRRFARWELGESSEK